LSSRALKLASKDVEQELASLNRGLTTAWQRTGNKLHKQFIFPDFVTAMRFMQSAAEKAEAMDHHPEWCNVYNKVTIDLTTHSVGEISSLDFELANSMERLFESYQNS